MKISSPKYKGRIGRAAFLMLLCFSSSTFAGSATWLAMPASGNWDTASNWNPATVPKAASDVATFSNSATTAILVTGSNFFVDRIVFDPSASAFTITARGFVNLIIGGLGAVNNSTVTQNLVVESEDTLNFGILMFDNTASVGLGISITTNGPFSGNYGGLTQFIGNSSAGSGTFTTNGGTKNAGYTRLSNNATAGAATFVTNGGAVNGSNGGVLSFYYSALQQTASSPRTVLR